MLAARNSCLVGGPLFSNGEEHFRGCGHGICKPVGDDAFGWVGVKLAIVRDVIVEMTTSLEFGQIFGVI